MNKKEVLHIIKQGESERIEFKTSFDKEVIETISAFANNKGGTVFIGIKDSWQLVGVNTGKESLQNWLNEIKTKTEPTIIPDINEFKIDGKTIVRIFISEFPIKPIAFKGRYFIRKQNSNHQLSVQEINDIYLQSTQTSWDSYPCNNYKYDDLDESKVLKFIDRVNQSHRFSLKGTPLKCLQKLKLVKNNVPTNAAMMLFSKGEMFCNVHIGRFKTPSLIIDDKMIRGDLYSVVEETLQFITKQIKVAFEITGNPQRNEIFEYPLLALRELVINAVVHRDYTSPTDIQIKIYDKEITIFNPGKLFGGLTIEDLKTDDYQAQTRNKLIAEAFYISNDIEKYGSGYRRVREQISKYPTMTFNFIETSGGYLVKIAYSEQKISNKNTKKDVVENVVENVVEDVIEDVVNKRLNKIIDLITQNNKISARQIAQLLKITSRTAQRDLDKLKRQNRIQRIGSVKSGHWEAL